MSDKKTGLGTAAFFQTAKKQQTAAPDEEREEKPEREKVSTSLRLYTDTLAWLETCKVHVRKTSKKRISAADLIDEAIKEWAEKRNVIL